MLVQAWDLDGREIATAIRATETSFEFTQENILTSNSSWNLHMFAQPDLLRNCQINLNSWDATHKQLTKFSQIAAQ